MSTPVSIQEKLFTTNTLASKFFLIFYIIIIWSSVFPVLLEFYLFWKLVEKDTLLFFLLLPIQIYIGYVILVLSSVLIAKFALLLTNKIHTPKEGVFVRNKRDRDYFFWSLRAVIKKWPIWVSKLIPLPKIDKLNLKWFENDSEFIDYGDNVSIGEGTSIKASMIFDKNLLIKKVKIEENVSIGTNCFISPGTRISKNSIIGAMSFTKFNQNLKSNSVYTGVPIETINTSTNNLINSLEKLEQSFSNKIRNSNNIKNGNDLIKKKITNEKFVTNLKFDLFIFGTIYFISNAFPILIIIYFGMEFFIPYFLNSPNFLFLFSNLYPLITFILTPLILIIIYIINLLIVIILVKVFYKIFQIRNPIKEGIFFWENRNKDYKNYFRRSFLLRYVKWKIQRSPFPWFIKLAFNFIGNCIIGKNTIIENSFLAKELLKIGRNVYLGKILTANHLWDKNLTVKKITIDDNVVICDLCSIFPGTNIKHNTKLLPLSITTKNETLSSDSVFYNAPIERISKEVLVNKFNLENLDLNQSKIKN